MCLDHLQYAAFLRHQQHELYTLDTAELVIKTVYILGFRSVDVNLNFKIKSKFRNHEKEIQKRQLHFVPVIKL